MPPRRSTPTSRLTRHYFETDAELWQFLTRPEARERGFTRTKIKKIVLSVHAAWALARTLQVVKVGLDVLPSLERIPKVESVPHEQLDDAALQRLVDDVSALAPLARRIHARLSAPMRLAVRSDHVEEALERHQGVRRRFRSLVGEAQLMAAFAVRTAERLGIARIEPVEMDGFVLIAGIRDPASGPDFGPNAERRTRRRANWKAALAKAPSVLAWIDSIWVGQPS